MLGDAELQQLKRKIAADVMAVGGVTGVGVGLGCIHVYLARDDAQARAAVERVAGADAPLCFIVSGEFEAR
jgi:hypothetical protein